jgi:3-hydroxy-9,10-secoandrosta-1,3,5(10)-triene-9,17-dione monooxygenase reductase component
MNDGQVMSVDPAQFRTVLGHFSTGIVVVTGAGPVGMTVQSVASLSLEPPLVLFCPAKSSTTWPSIRQAGAFCVNILARDQQDLCTVFARSGGDKFHGVQWRSGITGAPILADTLAHAECQLVDVHEGGDHDIAIGQVVALDVQRHAQPLLFFRGQFMDT